nr:MAG: hypothetical protein BECKSD772E_GA0070983_11503 [Candidatus Kentron sp. SD]
MGYFDKQWFKRKKKNMLDQERIEGVKTTVKSKGHEIMKALRLNIEKDIPIPEHLIADINMANRLLSSGTLKNRSKDEKSLMKKQLELMEAFEKGCFWETGI